MSEIQSAAKPVVTTGDRLFFTLFIAISVHVTLILGISFDLFKSVVPRQIIEVTLTNTPSEEAPKEADFMAQENQLGSGDLEDKQAPTTTEPADYTTRKIKQTRPVYPETAPQQHSLANEQVLKSKTSTRTVDQELIAEEPVETKSHDSTDLSPFLKELSLASLDTQLGIIDQTRTRDTRTYQISSISALKTVDAYYVTQWIKKIHRIGKLNYPAEARKRRIYGDLRLTVALLPDGTVKNIQIQRSSGHKLLDDAAVRIVRLASPFAPFPEQLRRQYDLLEITRTWVFSKDGQTPVL